MIRDPADCFTQTRRKTPSPQPSPRQLALANWHLSVAASASGCGWERGSAAAFVKNSRTIQGALSPLGERDRMRGDFAMQSTGVRHDRRRTLLDARTCHSHGARGLRLWPPLFRGLAADGAFLSHAPWMVRSRGPHRGPHAAAAGFLVLAAKLGAAPLLAAFIGILLARAVALRIAGRVS